MLLLRNQHQQYKNPLTRQRTGHEWTASSSLHDTISENV